jgi:branched-chain amino acid aminotransferase
MRSNIALWKLESSRDKPPALQEIHLDPALTDLNAVSKTIPGGVYTTFRTYERSKILPLDDQITRLEESARLVGTPLSLDETILRAALRQVLGRFPAIEMRLRLTIDLEWEPRTTYIALEPLKTPSEVEYANGVWAVTTPLVRHNPKSKHTAFLSIAEAVRDQLPEGVHEALLVGEGGQILEGLSSNFFAIRSSEIWTAKEEVLPGITRAIVLEEIQNERLPVEFQGFCVTNLSTLDEAFITSSSRSILSVNRIDQSRIGSGKPGPITRLLMQKYWQAIQSRLIEI